MSPDGQYVNKIDYTLVNKRFKNSYNDVRVYRGAFCGSNHCMVVGKQQFSDCNLVMYEIKNLKNEEICRVFQTKMEDQRTSPILMKLISLKLVGKM